jgi:hypothetical protein
MYDMRGYNMSFYHPGVDSQPVRSEHSGSSQELAQSRKDERVMNLPFDFGLKTCGFSTYAQGERFLEEKRIADGRVKERGGVI